MKKKKDETTEDIYEQIKGMQGLDNATERENRIKRIETVQWIAIVMSAIAIAANLVLMLKM